ncbi:MAG: cysteine synthase A [Paramuribaculum sp.]|nr:cysteine synthase A [Paramuribaculum sp.]
MKIYKNALELIGNTPLVELTNIEKSLDLKAHLLAKVEAFNPGGSAKDRIALAMIDDAERSGRLSPGATIIEPTSGNTGVGLAWIGAVKGYKVILTMPETMSEERKTLLRALGAELVLTPGAEGMSGAIRKAEEIRDATPGSMIMSQFDNPANPDVHRRTTGEEIWRDTDGEVDIFVAGVGTGGTLSGVAAALKARKPEVEAIAVEPAASPVLSGGKAGAHKIQGIGAGFVPGNYDASLVDEVIEVSDDSAFRAMRELAAKEGIFAGISSGAALAAAIEVARRRSSGGKTIVVLLPDTGQRYLSML